MTLIQMEAVSELRKLADAAQADGKLEVAVPIVLALDLAGRHRAADELRTIERLLVEHEVDDGEAR